MRITGNQIIMARAALGWSQEELADLCDLTRSTIVNIELGGPKKPREYTWQIIREAFEINGIKFVDNETHTGVLLCK